MITSAIFGFIGGMTRALVGLLKYYSINKKRKLNFGKILFTIIASSLIGVFCGLLVNTDPTLNLLAGYAGTDLIEGVYKIRYKQKVVI